MNPETLKTDKVHKLKQDAAEVLDVAKLSDADLFSKVSGFLPAKIDSLYQMALFLELMRRIEKVFPESKGTF